MEFEVHTAYDGDTLAHFVRLSSRAANRKALLADRMALLVLGALGTAGGCWFLLDGGADWLSIAILAVGLLLLVPGIFYLPYQRWRSKKSLRETAEEIIFTFREDAFTVGDKWKKTGYGYEVLQGLYEDGEYYFLFVNPKVGYLLRKRDFTAGTAEDFRAFLEARTGKSVQYVDRGAGHDAV